MSSDLTLNDFYIHQFRGLDQLELKNLSHVNIFVGANNCGKTSILEALSLFGAPDDMGKIVKLASQRAQVSSEAKKRNLVNYIASVFQKVGDGDDARYCISLEGDVRGHTYRYSAEGAVGEIVDSAGEEKKMFDVAIKVSEDDGEPRSIKFEVINDEESKFVSTKKPIYREIYFHSTVGYYRSCANLLSDHIAWVEEGKKEILQILQTFDQNVDDISVVGEDVYLHNALSGTMPLFSYGSGMQKAAFLAIAIAKCKNSVVLVDEIDNAIHVSAFQDVFRWFLNTCLTYHVQAFITTHSMEALDAILQIAHQEHKDEDALRVVTLRKDHKENITRSKIRTGEEAFLDREQFRMELRV